MNEVPSNEIEGPRRREARGYKNGRGINSKRWKLEEAMHVHVWWREWKNVEVPSQVSERKGGDIWVDIIMRCPFRWIPTNVDFRFYFLLFGFKSVANNCCFYLSSSACVDGVQRFLWLIKVIFWLVCTFLSLIPVLILHPPPMHGFD